jgi:hypothetical protein
VIRHGLSQTLDSDDQELRAWVAGQITRDQQVFAAKHPEYMATATYVATH